MAVHTKDCEIVQVVIRIIAVDMVYDHILILVSAEAADVICIEKRLFPSTSGNKRPFLLCHDYFSQISNVTREPRAVCARRTPRGCYAILFFNYAIHFEVFIMFVFNIK